MSNILKPLEPSFSKNVAAILANYPQIDGYILNLFRMFANSTRFLEKAVPNLLDNESPLTLRQRELVILRVTALHRCEYEWGVHVAVFAKAATLSKEEIGKTLNEALDQNDWTEKDFTLLEFVTRLIRQGRPQDALLKTICALFTREQQLEICALCGTYSTVSFAANISDLGLEPFASRFAEFEGDGTSIALSR